MVWEGRFPWKDVSFPWPYVEHHSSCKDFGPLHRRPAHVSSHTNKNNKVVDELEIIGIGPANLISKSRGTPNNGSDPGLSRSRDRLVVSTGRNEPIEVHIKWSVEIPLCTITEKGWDIVSELIVDRSA